MGKPAAERRLADIEAMAYARLVRSSPQKVNLVVQQIRGLACDKALAELAFSSRRVAGEVRKLLLSAIANAENNHQLDVDRLIVAEATVGRAMVLKRWRPRARGRVGRIQKPYSNIRLVLRERDEEDFV
ncbi:MAG: 50S ribosomal protein L22 [Rhodospirillales bacterium]|nr:MAG: 50S ribosomal protein L22 [Rhodospirillales bacterium]